jgi:hypothetical protein
MKSQSEGKDAERSSGSKRTEREKKSRALLSPFFSRPPLVFILSLALSRFLLLLGATALSLFAVAIQ